MDQTATATIPRSGPENDHQTWSRAHLSWAYFTVPGVLSVLALYVVTFHHRWDFAYGQGTHGFHAHLERHSYLLLVEFSLFALATVGAALRLGASRTHLIAVLALNVGIPTLWGLYVASQISVLRETSASSERTFMAVLIAVAAMAGWLVVTEAKSWRWVGLLPAAFIGWVDTLGKGTYGVVAFDVFAALFLGAIGFVLAMPIRPRVPHPATKGDVAATPDRTNTMAIIAFVSVWFISVVGIVLGHMALGEIRRTGERGRGLAIAALVLGYASMALLVVIGLVLAIAASHG